MSKFFSLEDNTGKKHYVNIDHITRVTYFTNAPVPHVYIAFSDGCEGIYMPKQSFEGIVSIIDGAIA